MLSMQSISAVVFVAVDGGVRCPLALLGYVLRLQRCADATLRPSYNFLPLLQRTAAIATTAAVTVVGKRLVRRCWLFFV